MVFNFYLYRILRRDGSRKLIRAFKHWDSAVDYLTTADHQANHVSDFEVTDNKGNTLANNRLIPLRITTLGRDGPGSGRITYTCDRLTQGNSAHTLTNGLSKRTGVIRAKNRPAIDVDGMPLKPTKSGQSARLDATAREKHESSSRSARRSNRRKGNS